MLLRVTISNFLSFYDEVTFDMFPSRQRKGLMNHIYERARIPVLKMGSIYGANNAGKSNFVKAIKFIQNVVLKQDFLTKTSYDNYRYKLVTDLSNPIIIEIEFSYDEEYYIYSIQLDERLHETLSLSGLGEKEDSLVYQRDGYKLRGENISNQEIVTDLLKKNPYTSVLLLNTRFPVIKSKHVVDVYNWFENNLQVVGINSSVSDLINMMNQNNSLLEFSDDMMRQLDISESLSIRKMDFEQWLETNRGRAFQDIPNIPGGNGELMASRNRRNEFHMISKDGKRLIMEFMFRQRVLKA